MIVTIVFNGRLACDNAASGRRHEWPSAVRVGLTPKGALLYSPFAQNTFPNPGTEFALNVVN